MNCVDGIPLNPDQVDNHARFGAANPRRQPTTAHPQGDPMQHSTAQPTEDLLDTQLAAYAERAARRRARPSTAEVLGCTAAAGGLAFAGGDALGAIVHNSTGTTLSVSSTFGYFNVNLDGAGNADWGVFLGGYANSAIGYHSNGGAGATVATGTSFAPAIPLAPGAVVGPTLASGVFNSELVSGFLNFSASSFGPFFNSATGYLGLRFDGDTGTVGTQYAWVKVHFDYAAPKLTMDILEWAYDDEGCAIAVGSTSGGGGCSEPVPAPATPLLTLLGLGAMGVAAYRRRREAGLKRLADEPDQAAA